MGLFKICFIHFKFVQYVRNYSIHVTQNLLYPTQELTNILLTFDYSEVTICVLQEQKVSICYFDIQREHSFNIVYDSLMTQRGMDYYECDGLTCVKTMVKRLSNYLGFSLLIHNLNLHRTHLKQIHITLVTFKYLINCCKIN